jgi:hypothetical protein
MSENSARDCLKPLVLTFAMLLLAMSSCVVAALRPLIAVSKAMIVSCQKNASIDRAVAYITCLTAPMSVTP